MANHYSGARGESMKQSILRRIRLHLQVEFAEGLMIHLITISYLIYFYSEQYVLIGVKPV